MPLLENIKQSFPRLLATLDSDLVNNEREHAFYQFLETGFPTKKDEEYKYTNLKEITEKEYQFFPNTNHQVSEDQLKELRVGEDDFDSIIFINGVLQTELSNITDHDAEFFSFSSARNIPQNAEVFSTYFNTIANNDLAFTDLNLAFSKEGFFLRVPKSLRQALA